MNEQRRCAEWYEGGPLVSKKIGNRLYEVWCNGIFQCSSPDNEHWKSGGNATEWLVARGITNDDELDNIVFSEKNGWRYAHNKWFELIVFEETHRTPAGILVENGCWQEIYNSGDVVYKYDLDEFNAWIDHAIADDKKELPILFAHFKEEEE
tara:strand:- start:342 stop:797 length:456 start_codon:yes stop_codon:yes gene_type:complete